MLRYKPRLIASFDNRLLGEIDAAHAKELLWSWVEAIPDRMLTDLMAVSDRKKFQTMVRMHYTPDRIDYKVVDDQIDLLNLATLGDHLTAYAQGWAKSFQSMQSRLFLSA